ncbi:MAG: AAA family ATPase [Solirubrobacterales bacterium]
MTTESSPRGPLLIGREAELNQLGDLLREQPPWPAAFVYGPGGIGKTTLLRELERRAGTLGYMVLTVDGRDPARAQRLAHEALTASRGAERALLVVDAYEHVAALGALLRSALGTDLGSGVRLLIAGRRPPEPAWSQGGWEELVRPLALQPLGDEDGRLLLERRGLGDSRAVEEIVSWAQGSPLALGVAAEALLAGEHLDLSRLDTDAGLAEALMRRLAGDELAGADLEVVAVAAIARAVDARLLAAVLPGVDADHAEAWLRGRSFAEPFGTRVTLHERVRSAARGALRAREPHHERELRRRIADHVTDRIALGELWMLPDLTELIDDPAVRWGISPSPGATHRFGPPERGDEERVAAALEAADTEWWSRLRRWFRESPRHVVVVRDGSGNIDYVGVGVTPSGAPAWAREDPVVARWLDDSRTRVPTGRALIVRDAIDLSEGSPAAISDAAALGNTALVVGSGLANVDCIYFNPSNETAALRDFRTALGWVPVPALDVVDGERTARCYLHDFGPAGVVGFSRWLVYRDLGLQPPDPRPDATVGAAAVRDALRSFHDPVALAASPLARGATTEQRTESVRRRLREAIAAAFGESEDERLLRAVVERAYLDPIGGHARSEAELHMSRSTYFRRLRSAVSRVCEQVLESRTRES